MTAQLIRSAAVRTLKPLVSDSVWSWLRRTGDRVLPGGADTGADAGIDAGADRLPEALTPDEERRRRLAAMDLTELALHFKTDKAGDHHYTQHYEKHLRHLKDERFTLLEIGIGGYSRAKAGGASLRMWKHFFPRAQVVGLDIEDKTFAEARRIKVYVGSQTDEKLLRRIVDEATAPLKVIVDDGSHRPEHIRETFEVLFPLLDEDGIYCIEDTQTSYWPHWGGSRDRQDPSTTMARVKELIDGLNYEEFLDEDYEPTYSDRHIVAVHCYHNLVVIEKGLNNEGTNSRLAR